MPKKEAKKLAHIFKVLSVDTRVHIIQLIKDNHLCVGALAAKLGITQGAVSQHLRILRDAGLVEAEKRGYYVHYIANNKTLSDWGKDISGFLDIKPSPKRTRKETHQCVMKRKSANTPKS